MSATVDPRRGRQLALGLLVLALLAAVAIVALPVWFMHHRYDVALEEGYGRLERYRRIAATRPAVARQLEALRAQDTRRFFLRGGAPALSAAEAQEIVRGLVEAAGGRLITMQALSPREEGRYRQISVSVQLTANVFALRRILSGIETHTPHLFVENLMVRTQVPGNFRPAPGAEPDMYVSLDVIGFTLAGNP